MCKKLVAISYMASETDLDKFRAVLSCDIWHIISGGLRHLIMEWKWCLKRGQAASFEFLCRHSLTDENTLLLKSLVNGEISLCRIWLEWKTAESSMLEEFKYRPHDSIDYSVCFVTCSSDPVPINSLTKE